MAQTLLALLALFAAIGAIDLSARPKLRWLSMIGVLALIAAAGFLGYTIGQPGGLLDDDTLSVTP